MHNFIHPHKYCVYYDTIIIHIMTRNGWALEYGIDYKSTIFLYYTCSRWCVYIIPLLKYMSRLI